MEELKVDFVWRVSNALTRVGKESIWSERFLYRDQSFDLELEASQDAVVISTYRSVSTSHETHFSVVLEDQLRPGSCGNFLRRIGKFMPGECYAGRVSFIDIPTLMEHPRRFLAGNDLVFKVYIENHGSLTILELLNNTTEEMHTSTERNVRELDERLREVEGKCGVLSKSPFGGYEHYAPLSSYPKTQSDHVYDHKNGIEASETAREVMRKEMGLQATDVNEALRREERLREDVREDIWTCVDHVDEAHAMIQMDTSGGAEHMNLLVGDSIAEVNPPDFSLATVRNFLDYAYTLQLPLNIVEQHGVQIWAIANRYEFSFLRKCVEDNISKVLRLGNVVRVAATAKKYQSRAIETTCLSFMREMRWRT